MAWLERDRLEMDELLEVGFDWLMVNWLCLSVWSFVRNDDGTSAFASRRKVSKKGSEKSSLVFQLPIVKELIEVAEDIRHLFNELTELMSRKLKVIVSLSTGVAIQPHLTKSKGHCRRYEMNI